MPGGFDLGSAFGLASGIVQGAAGLITAGRQRKAAKRLQGQADQEKGQAVGYANDILDQSRGALSQAQNNYQGRMAGATQAEQNIYGSQANTLAGFQRNATDASQLLALGGAAQGATNNAFQNLAFQETQDKQRRYGNLVGAQQGLQGAYGNLQDLYNQRGMMDQQGASQLGQASQQNQANALNVFGEMGQVAGMGGYNGAFPQKQQAGYGGPYSPINQRVMQPFQYTPPPAVNFSLPNASNIISSIRR